MTTNEIPPVRKYFPIDSTEDQVIYASAGGQFHLMYDPIYKQPYIKFQCAQVLPLLQGKFHTLHSDGECHPYYVDYQGGNFIEEKYYLTPDGKPLSFAQVNEFNKSIICTDLTMTIFHMSFCFDFNLQQNKFYNDSFEEGLINFITMTGFMFSPD